MIYVAFLRGINVGGKGIVSMASIREALVDLGLSDIRTHINSGNVIFSTRASDVRKLATRVEKGLQERTGMSIKVLVLGHKSLKTLVGAIPRNWVDDKTMRTYVLLLWPELDDEQILERLPITPGVDNVRYARGAVIWQVDRKDIGKSRMDRIIGTPYYKQMTIRSANTMRKLDELTGKAVPPAATD